MLSIWWGSTIKINIIISLIKFPFEDFLILFEMFSENLKYKPAVEREALSSGLKRSQRHQNST